MDAPGINADTYNEKYMWYIKLGGKMENLKKLFEICNLEPMVIIHDFGGNYEYVRAKRTNEYIIVTFKRDNITVMVFKDIQTMEVTFISLGIKEFICPMAKCPMLDLIVAEKNRR